ncbi:hypothetical protein CFC21_088369 [Triticum aestivum]|uniref:Uncharacterized protein n=3 Tax=Triticum TaxID=4564 RepID=A0A9R1BBB5_TRITD|nr:uncharacterized protein LOC119321897 isoform X2 [Triticum dicoccoides]XP_044413135.1 uncharacterized protein LOC123137442 isoform X2 [Triticum aestivum]KAF7084841.1 hypothetical protein CFC21_088369 [Triticum aestivum]VAI58373.1 unnamed protein product [Triticum turgidum subsp. durum]
MACSPSPSPSPRLLHRASASASPLLSVGHVRSAPSSTFGCTIHCKQSGHILYGRSHVTSFLALASADAPQGKGSSGQKVIMVDPQEAKRLAVKQMQEIRARDKLKKRRQAEAINGALAVIGLTAALVLEGRTGKGILGQLAGYLAALSSLFGQ